MKKMSYGQVTAWDWKLMKFCTRKGQNTKKYLFLKGASLFLRVVKMFIRFPGFCCKTESSVLPFFDRVLEMFRQYDIFFLHFIDTKKIFQGETKHNPQLLTWTEIERVIVV